MPWTIRRLTAAEHLAWIAAHGPVSFLQTPAWGQVKPAWTSTSVGLFGADGVLAGTALVLYRRIRHLRYGLAYVPEGPALNWAELDDPVAPLQALAAYVRDQGAFALTVGPPVPWWRWRAATLKAALAAAKADPTSAALRLEQYPADLVEPTGAKLVNALRAADWQAPIEADGFAAGQPDMVFQLPLTGATEESLLAGLNQLWRRNIRKAEAAGVVVTQGGQSDLAAFHTIYAETAARDGFRPRPLSYFVQMWQAMTAEDSQRLRLYLARHQDDVVAATLMAAVGGHVWYAYGASTTAKRDVRGSNAIQWRMIRDALSAGAAVYDLRGITASLDPTDSHVGLIQFKVGTGGEVVRYPGEWTKVLRPLLYRAYQLALARR